MNIIEYENYHEKKSHVDSRFPYNTYLCTIPLDFERVPTHWHDELEIIVIKKGKGIIFVDLLPHPVSDGYIIVILPGQLHAIVQEDQEIMEYENILFQINMLFSAHIDICTQDFFMPMLQRTYHIPTFYTNHLDYYDTLISCITTIDRLSDTRPPAYQLGLKSLWFQFFYIIFTNHQHLNTSKKTSKSLDKLKKILKYVEEHYNEFLSIEKMAELSGFSQSHFMKFFKTHMGVSFIDYLNDYRLTMSTRLLQLSGNSILEIAQEVGFDNLSYFNRLFKKKYNMTPSAYRNTH